MRYLSLFSGIEAATVAWKSLGWECVAVAEIEPFPCAVLAHHYPDVPNLGDVTTITAADIAALGQIDLVVFGSPCQDLSVAGKRKGLAGARSGLFHTAIDIVQWAREFCGCRWALWENVPGAFTSNQGRDFATVVELLAGLDELTVPPKGWGTEGCAVGEEAMVEWSVLDAQWFGVAQRRRRVFAVADFGDWASRPPVLLEPKGLRGDSAPSRKAGQEVAGTLASRTGAGGFPGTDEACSGYIRPVVGARMAAFGQYEQDETASCMKARDYKDATDLAVVGCIGGQHPNAAIDVNLCPTLTSAAGMGGGHVPLVDVSGLSIRRLTPTECERLQGFPDNYTLIPDWYECCGIAFAESLGKYGCANCNGDSAARLKQSSDTVRYKALGNSMAVPVMHWIGHRIDVVGLFQ